MVCEIQKHQLLLAGAPFPFPRFRAFLPLPSPSPSPFCTCHAGYPSEQKTTLRPTNIISLSRRKYSLLFWRIWSGVTIAHFLIRFMGDLYLPYVNQRYLQTCNHFPVIKIQFRAGPQCSRIMGWRKLLVYVRIVVTAIFDFMTAEDCEE